ncbi:MAG: Ig-like domain-containing protein [Lysobacteraceae bacterium]
MPKRHLLAVTIAQLLITHALPSNAGVGANQTGPDFVVNALGDSGNGSCGDLAGECTLRDAVLAAESNADASIISFDPAVFNSPTTISLVNGELAMRYSTTITGPGAKQLTIDGGGNSRIFHFVDPANPGAALGTSNAIQNLNLTGGNGTDDLGVSGTAGRGGAIRTLADLSLQGVVVNANDASADGAGIWSRHSDIEISDSTLSNNTTSFKGGAMYVRDGSAVVENTTFSGNAQDVGNGAGGAIYTRAPFQLINSTVVGSSGSNVDSSAIDTTSTATLRGTVVSGSSSADLGGTFRLYDSLIEAPGVATISTQVNSLTGIDPMLGSLGDFGGDTPTIRPLTGSPAIDHFSGCGGTDQRGIARGQDGDGSASATECDVGAVELGAALAGPDFVVNATDDEGDGVCEPSPFHCNLRDAVTAAESNADLSVISFDPVVFSSPTTISLVNGELAMRYSTTINGPGAKQLTIDGGSNSRLLHFADLSSPSSALNTTNTVEGLSLTGGSGTNTSGLEDGRGGAIRSVGNLIVSNVNLFDNESQSDGGAIWQRHQSLTIRESTISGSTAKFYGGGVYLRSTLASITDSTLTGNTLTAGNPGVTGGAAFATSSTLDINASTVVANGANRGAVGTGNTATLRNSIVSGSNNDDLFGSFRLYDSIIESPGTATIVSQSNTALGMAPALGTLGDHGGDTPTILPLAGSTAIDHFAGCSGSDQRGETRGVDGNATASAIECDVGATEFQYTSGFVATGESGESVDEDAGAQALNNILANEIDHAPSDDNLSVFSVVAVDGSAANVDADYDFGGGRFHIDEAGNTSFQPLAALDHLDDGETVNIAIDYTVSDGVEAAATTLTFAVSGQNDAPVTTDSADSTNQDSPKEIDLLASDAEGHALNASIVDPPVAGQVSFDNPNLKATFDPNGNFDHLDDGEHITIGFRYKVNDGSLDSNPAIVAMTVNGLNDAPTSTGSSRSTSEDAPTTFSLQANDVDAEPLTAILVTPPSAGQLSFDNPALLATFDPDGDFEALDDGEQQLVSFAFKVNDGDVDSNTSTVNVTVNGANDAPTAQGTMTSTGEDSSVSISLSTLTSDPDTGDVLAASIVTAPTAGLASVDNLLQTLTFETNGQFESLDDGDTHVVGFEYKVNDGDVDSAAALVMVTVNGVNDAPTAQGAAVSTSEDSSVSVDYAALTSDPDAGDVLTAEVVGFPASGQVNIDNVLHTIGFEPNGEFEALDDGESQVIEIQYRVNDGDENSGVAQIDVTVNGANDAPIAGDDTAATDQDNIILQGLPVTDVDVEPQTLTLVSPPAAGSVSLDDPTLAFTFSPGAAFKALDSGESQIVSFEYLANDGDADSNTGTVDITVFGVNDAPAAVADDFDAVENQTLTVDATNGLLANDSDIDAEPVVAVAGTFTPGGIGGSLTINSDGSFSYTPPPATTGTATYGYSVSDGDATSMATLTINVLATPTIDLAVTKTDGVDIIAASDVLTYTITVSNAGPADAANVYVSDPLPPELGNASWTCEAVMPGPATSCDIADGTGNIGEFVDIGAGDSIVFELMATVDAGLEAGVVINSASAEPPGDRVDIDLGNNLATDIDATALVFADGFEGSVMPLRFDKRLAEVARADIEQRLAHDIGLKPVLVAKATASGNDGLLLLHARRVGIRVELRLSRYEHGEWLLGNWQVIDGADIQLRW